MTGGLQLWLGLVPTLAGGLCLYLGTPRQRWRARPWPAGAALAAGAALMLAGWILWCFLWHPAAALFATLTAAMLGLILMPVLAVLTAGGGR
ncbi:MAG: hypothetical protein F8N37_21655 [Telmatospirillum sp.]|nr:hypothetical protein [Telmatospirillum sp.]